jgi:hypothetical protein
MWTPATITTAISCSTLTSCSLTTTTTACAPAAPQLASVTQGDRHADDPLREDQGCPRRQPKQPESLRLWRSDRMWTPPTTTTATSATMIHREGDGPTLGRRTRQGTRSDSDAHSSPSHFVQIVILDLMCFASIYPTILRLVQSTKEATSHSVP